jgi:cystathionine beta-lyase/cystathionine gamma-synthase
MSDNNLIYHSVTTPLFLSTSWLYKTNNYPNRSEYSYSRNEGPNFAQLENAISNLYNSKYTVLFPSGLSAISSVLNSFYNKDKKILIISHHELYDGSITLLQDFSNKYNNFKIHFIDLTDIDILKYIIQNDVYDTVMIYCESLSNPSAGYIDTLSIVKKYKTIKEDIVIIVDNSWLSTIYNPFNYGADIVIESISKNMSGGDVIAGLVTTSNEQYYTNIQYYTELHGIRMSPFDAYNTLKGISTLEIRLNKIGYIGFSLAIYLENHKNVDKVLYPLLKSHKSYKIVKNILNVGPGLLFFHILLDKDNTMKMIESSKIILLATSYGKSESMFDPYIMEDCEIYPFIINENQKIGTWIRLSIGYSDNFEILKNELDRLLTIAFTI